MFGNGVRDDHDPEARKDKAGGVQLNAVGLNEVDGRREADGEGPEDIFELDRFSGVQAVL